MFSPNSQDCITKIRPIYSSGFQGRGRRTMIFLMISKENTKTGAYTTYLWDILKDHITNISSTTNIFNLVNIDFVPAVMTIYGNIGPAFDNMLRGLAQMQAVGFDPSLHPVRDSFFMTEQQSIQARYRRYKCLIAAAHCRALAKTFSVAAAYRRPARREEARRAEEAAVTRQLQQQQQRREGMGEREQGERGEE